MPKFIIFWNTIGDGDSNHRHRSHGHYTHYMSVKLCSL